MIVTHIFISIPSRWTPDASSACSRPNALIYLVGMRPDYDPCRFASNDCDVGMNMTMRIECL